MTRALFPLLLFAALWLDPRIDALVERLRAGASAEARALGDLLAAPAGRTALVERLDTLREEARREAEEEALHRILLARFLPPDPAYVSWLAARAQAYDADLKAVARVVARMRAGFRGEGGVERAFRGFLDRPDAPDLLYRSFVRPHLRRDLLTRGLGGAFVDGDDGRIVIPDAAREIARERLDRARARAAGGDAPRASLPPHDLEGVRLRAREIAGRLSPRDDLHRAYAAFLRSPDAPHLAAAPVSPTTSAGRVLLEQTPFGRWLVIDEEKGTVRLNRHTLHEVDARLRDLDDTAAERAGLERALGAFTERLEDESLGDLLSSAGGRGVLLGRVLRSVDASRRRDPLDRWVATWLRESEEGLVPTEAADPEIRALAERAAEVAVELAAAGSETRLDLAALPWSSDHAHLLTSSIFLNPRTAAGGFYYAASFPDHEAARLFGLWGWNAAQSKNAEDFLARVRKRRPGIERLAKTHEKLIIHIAAMPPWLSRSEDEGELEGERRSNREAHPPRDPRIWQDLVRSFVTMFRDLPVERYYEFWNEPDLKYWQADLDDFLTLYGETARAIREADPKAKIGGPAPNQWDGRIRKSKDQGPVVLELIRYAKEHDLPLDFVSWHHFGRPLTVLKEAKAAFEQEIRHVGIEHPVEMLVTEWSSPGRGTPYAGSLFGDVMLALFEAGVDAQTASCWEEFHAKPDPKHFPPWGLMTQQGVRKNMWYVHRFLDRLSRDSEGLAVVRDDRRTLVLSRKPDGVYDLVLWQKRPSPPLAAAWKALEAHGFGQREGRAFQTMARLEDALRAGTPPAPRWQEAWTAAREAYDAETVRTLRLQLTFENAGAVEVLGAEGVTMAHRQLDVRAVGNRVTCALEPYEVARITLRVR